MPSRYVLLAGWALLMTVTSHHLSAADRFDLRLRSQTPDESKPDTFRVVHEAASWEPATTAVIVCDMWDAHHCFNAVERLKQFAPRLDRVLSKVREAGGTIIHAPSDCMDAYDGHPARQRAVAAPVADDLPQGVESWCSVIPSEERAAYPIDQSDGGEDDDPDDHARWAATLKSQGRDTNMPWLRQTDLLTIDRDRDFVSDRGDEVWNVLRHRGIDNVILVGVHTNMCVLGRPFGLRQMARNGKNVVLMRDMTDTMYNPQRWPFVSHFEGTRLIVSHVERFVCPTVTSDQLIGGARFRFAGDVIDDSDSADSKMSAGDPGRHWVNVQLAQRAGRDHDASMTVEDPEVGDLPPGSRWLRCVIRIPESWADRGVNLSLDAGWEDAMAWCNGQSLGAADVENGFGHAIPRSCVEVDDANWLVIRLAKHSPGLSDLAAPLVSAGNERLELAGSWQLRVSDDPGFSSAPLPAKFGGSADVVHSPPEPLWVARTFTRRGAFTPGIEGPACDANGNVFAVNYRRQGTVGCVRPDGRLLATIDLPDGSVGNGIRFAKDGTFFVADYMRHQVLRVDPKTLAITVHASEPKMNQPNDLAITPDGKTLFASDPNWAEGTGNLWRIDSDGATTLLAENMGTTNGVEVSPDGRTLYVNESAQRNVWAFEIADDRSISEKRLFAKFDDHGFDGMRCDAEGNLYITRHGKGTVVKMSPEGKLLREIPVLGSKPTNLCFGGPDGRTLYVTEVDGRRLVQFRVDHPGRVWAERQ